MITFFICIALLICGYLFYSRFIEKIFSADKNRQTPAYSMTDGVDYVPMGWARAFLIQFLNIAGLGPIFGAILGAAYGPVVFIWIVLGCIFGGAVHDYFSGMLSVRNQGMSISEIVGKYLGPGFMQFMRAFTLILMVLVGAVFVKGPASILAALTPEHLHANFWMWVVFIYYFLATMLPIDKLIGRIYPLFGAALLFMALGISGSILFGHFYIPELIPSNMVNMKADAVHFPVFPLLFITVACGAVSGFHSTQSPLMARCLKNEMQGRKVFYGAMITEGVVAMIWAAAAMAYFGSVPELNAALAEHRGDAAWVVNELSKTLLGKVGGILAILGVVAAPITSGDTAFRSGRLIAADFLRFRQKKVVNRLIVAAPLFLLGFLLTQIKFDVIWRYFAWSNQTLATVVLWAITVYLATERKLYIITLIPAIFMTAVISTYILIAPEGFHLNGAVAYPAGLVITAVISVVFFLFILKNRRNNQPVTEVN